MLKLAVVLASAIAILAANPKCSSATDALKAKCTGLYELEVGDDKLCASAACAVVDFTTDAGMCCKAKASTPNQKCSAATDALKAKCTGLYELEVGDDKFCAKAACAVVDFTTDKGKCCKAKAAIPNPKCSSATDALKAKCTGSNEPETGDDKLCASAACADDDFASDKGKCCKVKTQKCSAATDALKAKCTGLYELEVGDDKFCAKAACAVVDFTTDKGKCCKVKTQKCSAASSTLKAKCTGDNKLADASANCATAVCAEVDFKSAAGNCCTAKTGPKDSGASSLLPNFVLAAAGFLALY